MVVKCYGCNYSDNDECNHPHRTKDNWYVGDYINHEQGRPSWCPLQQEIKNMGNKNFDFENSTAQVKNNAMTAFETAKNVVVQMQQGKTVITAVKAALQKAPGCPDNLKVLLLTPYGDLVVGLILHTVAPVLTGSPMIMKAVKAANVAGAVEVSQQFTFIQDAIESAIGSIPGFDDLKGLAKGKLDEVIEDAKEEEANE